MLKVTYLIYRTLTQGWGHLLRGRPGSTAQVGQPGGWPCACGALSQVDGVTSRGFEMEKLRFPWNMRRAGIWTDRHRENSEAIRVNWSQTVSAGLRAQEVMKSFRVEGEDLRGSSSLMGQGQGPTRGRVPPIAVICASQRVPSAVMLGASTGFVCVFSAGVSSKHRVVSRVVTNCSGMESFFIGFPGDKSPRRRLGSSPTGSLFLSCVVHWVVLGDCHKQGGHGLLTLNSFPR